MPGQTRTGPDINIGGPVIGGPVIGGPVIGGPVIGGSVRSRRSAICRHVLGVLVCLAPAAPAASQSVDYSGFEQLLDEPVTTSATGKPQRISEVPANMEIITADDIRRSGADNIPDILQFVAGMDVRRYGFAAADVSVRGYNETSNPRLLVLLNGQQIYLDDIGRVQWYTLPVELAEIRQIEIVKGPNTALFGFNAASGVINIITYDPAKESVNSVTASAGTQGYTALSAVGTGQIADVGGLRVSAGGFRAGEFSQSSISSLDRPFLTSPQRNAFSFDARVQATPSVQVFASGSIVDSRSWEVAASPFYETDYQRTNWARAGLAAETSLGVLGFTVYRNELLATYRGVTGSVDVNDAVVVVQATDLVKLGSDHTVRIGLDYRDNSASSSSSALAGKVGYDVYSGSAMWDWQILPALSLTNAVRYDHLVLNQQGPLIPVVGFAASAYQQHTIDEPSFNSGLVWKATEPDTFRLLAARGLQLPSILDFGLQDLKNYGPETPTLLFLGNPGIKPTSVANLELDWDRALPGIDSTLRLAVFGQRTDDIITNPYEAPFAPDGVFQAGVPQLRAIAANVGHSNAEGGEIGLRGHAPAGFRWNASYSFISIADHLVTNPQSPQNFQQGTPTHVVVLGGGYTIGRWEFDAQSRWQSWYLDYRADPATLTLLPQKIGNYVLADARAGYRLTDNITVALSAQQFNVSRLAVTAGPPIERRVFVTVTVHL